MSSRSRWARRVPWPVGRLSPLLAAVGFLLLLGLAAAAFSRPADGAASPDPARGPLRIDRVAFHPGHIALSVVGDAAGDLEIAQVIVNQAIWSFTAAPARRIAPGQRAEIGVAYPWLAGEQQEVKLVTSGGQTAVWSGSAREASERGAPVSDGSVMPWAVAAGGLAVAVAAVWLIAASRARSAPAGGRLSPHSAP